MEPPAPPGSSLQTKSLEFWRMYMRELEADGSITSIDFETALWVCDQFEIAISFDQMLQDHPDLRIRISGLEGKYGGLKDKTRRARDTRWSIVWKEKFDDDTIKGQGRVSILQNLASADLTYMNLNAEYARYDAAYQFFARLSEALSERHHNLVQISKNLRED